MAKMTNLTNIGKTTRNGKPAVYITCDCPNHPGDTYSAVITGPAGPALMALEGRKQEDRIHGFVSLANHPADMMRRAAERDGVYATGDL